jgi:enoyl-CoA hydratase
MALTKQAFNFVEDLRGKRQAMDGVFHMHHLAHAHNQLMTGHLVGGLGAKAMAAANKKQAEDKE